jgi:hypothetical protein
MVQNIRSITTIPSHISKQVSSSVFNGEIFSFVIRELTVVGNGVKYSGRRYWLALDVSMMTVEPRSALDLVRHRELVTNWTSVSRLTKLDYKKFKKFFFIKIYFVYVLSCTTCSPTTHCVLQSSVAAHSLAAHVRVLPQAKQTGYYHLPPWSRIHWHHSGAAAVTTALPPSRREWKGV